MTADRLPWGFPEPFTRSFHVDEQHNDLLEHTNNTVYVNWCMETAWAHTSALGLGAEQYRALDRAMALTRAEYDYLRATRLGDALLAGTWITRWDKKLTMERRVQLIDSGTGDTVLRARLEFVCIAISSGRPKRPPPAFIAGYGPAIVGQ